MTKRIALNNAGRSQQASLNQSFQKKKHSSQFKQNYNQVSPPQFKGKLPPLGPGKGASTMTLEQDGVEPQLVCTERELASNIEDEIKNGFFELKQKFTESGPSSIYISHITLH